MLEKGEVDSVCRTRVPGRSLWAGINFTSMDKRSLSSGRYCFKSMGLN